MCDNHRLFLAFLDDLLAEVALVEADNLTKHALVRKEIHRKTHSVVVPKLGTIHVLKKCCTKKSCPTVYEVRNLQKVRKLPEANFQREEIELPTVENAVLVRTLKAKERLRALEEKDVSKVLHCNEWIYARLFRVIDGDTLLLGLELGETALKISLRVAGVDCPETKRAGPLEVRAGLAAKQYVEKLYENVVVVRVKLTNLDKWGGRWVGYAEVPALQGGVCDCGCGARSRCLTTLLLAKGYAKCYGGEKKEVWTESQLKRIA